MGLLRKTAKTVARLVPQPGNPHHTVPLSGAQPNVIGRRGEGQLAIDHGSLSRRHATIWFQDDQWWVHDEQSSNGTFVNGTRIESAALAVGDVLSLGGELQFRLETGDDVSDPAAVPAGGKREVSSPLARMFCLGLAPQAGGRPLILKGKVTIVGRNKTCDLVIDENQVSGIHARIRRHGSEVSILDSGSRNGTVVNGETVRRAVLHPGDEVVFGGTAFTVRQTFMPTGAMVASLAGVSLAIVLAILLPALFRAGTSGVDRLWTRDMYVSQVSESMVLALRAIDDEPPIREVARAQFAVARRSLVAADLVPLENATDEDWREAFRKAALDYRVSRELRNRDIYDVYVALDAPEKPAAPEPEVAAETPAAPAEEKAAPQPKARLTREEFDLEQELSSMVAQFGIDTRRRPIPPEMLTEVDRFIDFWTGPKRSFTQGTIKRSAAHLEMIQTAMADHQLPEIFAYLPFIESGYQESVSSPAKARGLWQFMPATGKAYGLRVDDEVDERTDPVKSTEAACRYLDSLLNMFGPNAFLCAVAAYNKGENGMARCLKKYGDWRSTWKFWDVAAKSEGCLKQETLEYVPRFLAAAVIMRRPDVFGL